MKKRRRKVYGKGGFVTGEIITDSDENDREDSDWDVAWAVRIDSDDLGDRGEQCRQGNSISADRQRRMNNYRAPLSYTKTPNQHSRKAAARIDSMQFRRDGISADAIRRMNNHRTPLTHSK